MSHFDEAFSKLDLSGRRNFPQSISAPDPAYVESPRLSAAKYGDLKALTTGDTPLISHTDHQQFYLNLPHC